jgi:hypothetical protein
MIPPTRWAALGLAIAALSFGVSPATGSGSSALRVSGTAAGRTARAVEANTCARGFCTQRAYFRSRRCIPLAPDEEVQVRTSRPVGRLDARLVVGHRTSDSVGPLLPGRAADVSRKWWLVRLPAHVGRANHLQVEMMLGETVHLARFTACRR